MADGYASINWDLPSPAIEERAWHGVLDLASNLTYDSEEFGFFRDSLGAGEIEPSTAAVIADILAQSTDPAIRSFLLNEIGRSRSQTVRIALIRALTYLPPDFSIATANDGKVRAGSKSAGRQLAPVTEPDLKKSLLNIGFDTREPVGVRVAVLRSVQMGLPDDKELQPLFRQSLLGAKEEEVRVWASRIVFMKGNSLVSRNDMDSSPYPDVRALGVTTRFFSENEQDVGFLLGAANDAHPFVRAAAVNGLGTIQSSQIRRTHGIPDLLIGVLGSDSDATVRQRAAQFLAASDAGTERIGEPVSDRCYQALWNAARYDSNGAVRLEAIKTLSRHPSEQTLKDFDTRLAGEADPQIRAGLEAAIKEIRKIERARVRAGD